MERKILCVTERLIVRHFLQSDLEELYRILSDPKVMACLEPPYTHEQTERFCGRLPWRNNRWCMRQKTRQVNLWDM